MNLDRRRMIGAATLAAGAMVVASDPARSVPLTSTLGRDAAQSGVRAGSADDQTRILQKAIDDAARAGMPLA